MEMNDDSEGPGIGGLGWNVVPGRGIARFVMVVEIVVL